VPGSVYLAAGLCYAQDLVRRAGHPKDDAGRQVLGMSAVQCRAWLDAFIDAEGHREGEYVSVTQSAGVAIAWSIASCRARLASSYSLQARPPSRSAMVIGPQPGRSTLA